MFTKLLDQEEPSPPFVADTLLISLALYHQLFFFMSVPFKRGSFTAKGIADKQFRFYIAFSVYFDKNLVHTSHSLTSESYRQKMIDQAEEEERLRKQDEADGMCLLQNYVQFHFEPEPSNFTFMEIWRDNKFFKALVVLTSEIFSVSFAENMER